MRGDNFVESCVPFSILKFLCKICVEKEVFEKEENSRIPVYLKLMASLRILACDPIAHDVGSVFTFILC